MLKKWEEDDGFEHIMRTKHELRNTPQVYGNGLGRVRTSRINNTQDARDLGRLERRGTGGSPEQIFAAVKLGLEYLKVEDTSTDGLAREIDQLMPQRHYAKSPFKRKYIPTDASLANLRQWFRSSFWSLETAMKEMSEEEKKTDVEWTFLEAGFGVSGSNRGPNHVWHDGTNYLFGLMTACMMHPRPRDFEIRTFAIIQVMKPEHADPCEVLASLCGGTYGRKGWEGFGMHGLNPALAGGAVLNAPHKEKESDRAINLARYDEVWEHNRKKVEENYKTTLLKSRDADTDKLNAWGQALNARAGCVRLERVIAEHPQKKVKARRELAEAKEAVERGIQSEPELLAALEEFVGVESDEEEMRPPPRPLRILPSSSPPEEARDGREDAVVVGSEPAETERVWESIEHDDEQDEEEPRRDSSPAARERSVVRESTVARGSSVVPESSWVEQARQSARGGTVASHITVSPNVQVAQKRFDRPLSSDSHITVAPCVPRKRQAEGDNAVAPQQRATLRRPTRVQGEAASEANRGMSVFEIPEDRDEGGEENEDENEEEED